MDAQASLWPCEIDVELGGWVYTIPEHPASTWIFAIGQPEGGAIVPGMFNDTDQRFIYRDYLAGKLDPEELGLAWREVLEAAVGRRWWEVARLILDVLRPEIWPIIHGRMIRYGLDLDRISLGAFWNAVYTMALEGCKDEDARSRFKFDLTTPPPEELARERYDATEAGNDFVAAMQALQRAQGG